MRARSLMTVSVVALAVSCSGAARLPPAPAPPAPAAADVPVPQHAEDVASYTLRATLDPAKHTVHGEGTITWRNVSRAPVHELWLHLYLNAFKNQSSAFMREPVGGFRGSTIPKDWGTIDVRRLTWVDAGARRELWPGAEKSRPGDDDETDARVPLPREVAPGETMTLEVVWDDKLPTIVERTGYDGSFHMVGQWFPKIAKIEQNGTFAHFPFHHLAEFYADYGRYDVTLDVPEAFVVGATGPVVESHVAGGRRVERHVQSDIHDFAWTAWDRFQVRHEKVGGVEVTVLYPPGASAGAERELRAIRFGLPYYGALYGEYPYGVLTLVHPPSTSPEAGGMEYPTLITTGESPWVPPGVRALELVTIHELGHQWFYGLVATYEGEWPFLDEGLNSYAELESMGAWLGPGSLVDVFGLTVSDAAGNAERSRHFAHDERVAQPASAFDTGRQYGALVYSRTGTIMETLRRVYGDALMRRALGTYTRRFRYRHPVPVDLINVFREIMGEQASDALRAALFQKGWADYVATSMSSHPARPPAGIFDVAGKRETVPSNQVTKGKFDGWVLVTRRGTLTLPVEIELVAADGTSRRVRWDGEAESTRIPYSGASPLAFAVVDPDRAVLLDQDPTNNAVRSAAHAPGTPSRALERATYWAELAVSMVAP